MPEPELELEEGGEAPTISANSVTGDHALTGEPAGERSEEIHPVEGTNLLVNESTQQLILRGGKPCYKI